MTTTDLNTLELVVIAVRPSAVVHLDVHDLVGGAVHDMVECEGRVVEGVCEKVDAMVSEFVDHGRVDAVDTAAVLLFCLLCFRFRAYSRRRPCFGLGLGRGLVLGLGGARRFVDAGEELFVLCLVDSTGGRGAAAAVAARFVIHDRLFW
jgi:hypothetical protein